MQSNNDIQAALIAYLKANVNIVAALGDSGADEIREDQWQSDQFIYQNIRVRLIDNAPEDACNKSIIEVSFMVYSEEQSSQQADSIAGIIKDELKDRSFTSNTIRFTSSIIRLVPAIRQDTLTWRAEAIFRMRASG
jgi:hypothetical protein